MKTRREQSKEEIMVIKLFASNYAKDLLCTTIIEHYHKMLYGILNILHSYYVIYMNKQLVFGVIAVVFATALISSLVVDQASADRNKAKRGNGLSGNGQGNGQSIAQSCEQSQSSSIVTAGSGSSSLERDSILPIPISGSGVTGSGINGAQCTNTNNGGNAAS